MMSADERWLPQERRRMNRWTIERMLPVVESLSRYRRVWAKGEGKMEGFRLCGS